MKKKFSHKRSAFFSPRVFSGGSIALAVVILFVLFRLVAPDAFLTEALLPQSEPLERAVRGRDLATGLPREIIITDTHVRESLAVSLDGLLDALKEVVEQTPPELLSDILEHGVTVFGGGALLRGLPELLEKMIGVPVHISADPLTVVARGTGIITENPETFKEIFLHEEEILSQT